MSVVSNFQIDGSPDQKRCLEDKHQLNSFWGSLTVIFFLLKNCDSEIPIHTYKDDGI